MPWIDGWGQEPFGVASASPARPTGPLIRRERFGATRRVLAKRCLDIFPAIGDHSEKYFGYSQLGRCGHLYYGSLPSTGKRWQAISKEDGHDPVGTGIRIE